MRVDITFLRSKVARRVFLLFVTCAMLPIGALTVLSFRQVTSQLLDDGRKQLQQESKSQGMSIYERLEIADDEMRTVTLALGTRRGRAGVLMPQHLEEHFAGLAISGPGQNQTLAGVEVEAPRLNADELGYLRRGESLLVAQPAGRQEQARVLLLRALSSSEGSARILVGEVSPDYLWSADKQPPDRQLCVVAQDATVVFCPSSGAAELRKRLVLSAPRTASGFLDWSDGSQQYQASFWSIFLKPKFAAPGWRVVVSQSESSLLAPITHFKQTFPYVILLSLWVVLLLSLVQIRRTLVPLERLQEGTRRIAEQEFDAQVDIRSGDEFQELAGSFNVMAGRLGRQFQALKAIDEIDRAILSSLKKNEILQTVLLGMEGLLPHDLASLSVFDGGVQVEGRTYYSREPGSAVLAQPTFRPTKLSGDDLELLRTHPESHFLELGAEPPAYLRPLAEQGIVSALVNPVFLDGQLLAILALGYGRVATPTPEDVQYARQIADQLAVALSNAGLVEALDRLHWGTLTALARAIDAKSEWTAGHSERVTRLAVEIAKEVGLAPHDLDIIHRGGLLHDIGKIGTPPTILEKAGKLSGEEMAVMRDHVRIGARILEPIPGFKEILHIVAEHHEWFDGNGYPAGLAGEQIHIHARIFAVADCYDAMTSDRPYRPGMPRQEVVEIMKEAAGTQFDPEVIQAFLRVLGKQECQEREIAETLATSPLVNQTAAEEQNV